MKASTARRLTKAYKPPKYSSNVLRLLEYIKRAAKSGSSQFIVSEPVLFPEDWGIFEKLGYKVVRPHQEGDFWMFGSISW